MSLLDDPARTFASSDLVKLEVLPKAVYHRNEAESQFYQEFFDSLTVLVPLDSVLFDRAYAAACLHGLNAFDATVAAAAEIANCGELWTTEKLTKPLHRVKAVEVKTVAE